MIEDVLYDIGGSYDLSELRHNSIYRLKCKDEAFTAYDNKLCLVKRDEKLITLVFSAALVEIMAAAEAWSYHQYFYFILVRP